MKKEMECILILTNGKTCQVSFPEDILDDVFKEITTAFNFNEIWYCEDWCELKAKIGSEIIHYIDFKKVIGMRF